MSFTKTMGRMYAYGSPSSNTDMIVFLQLGYFINLRNDRVFIVTGSGSNKEHYKFSDFEINIESTITLLDLRVFMGNDYESSFFRKGREKC